MALSGVAKVVKLAGALGAFKIGEPDKTLDYRQFSTSCLDGPAIVLLQRGMGPKKSQLALAFCGHPRGR
jgi:hypothetical protein